MAAEVALTRHTLSFAARGRGFSDEAKALFARMTGPPDPARKALYDNLIRALKASVSVAGNPATSIWAKLDALYLLAAHDAQAAQRNIRQDLYNLAPVSAPVFAADGGYTGDGVDDWLATGFNASTAGGNFTQNSAHMAVWTGTAVADVNRIDVGAISSYIVSRIDATTGACRGNAAASAVPVLTDLDGGGPAPVGVGSLIWSRNADAANVRTMSNGAAAASTAVASAALVNATMAVGAVGSGVGVAANFSTRQIRAACFGGGLTDQQMLDLHTALAAFLAGADL